jgi:murein DD-endopeptidase MepM/ murein hydrolase activator NlpD
MIALAPIKDNQQIRGCNSTGCGSFGASRGGRAHNGIDINFDPDEIVKSPINGVVTRTGFRVYSNSRPELKGMEIQADSGEIIKLFYVKDWRNPGTRIKKGDYIARAVNMTQYYSAAMPNHVHIELRQNGVIQDITNWFKSTGSKIITNLAAVGLLSAAAYFIYQNYGDD